MFDWKGWLKKAGIAALGALIAYFSNGTLTICYTPPKGSAPVIPAPDVKPTPIPQPPAPKPAADPKEALGRYRTSRGSGCSLTIVGPRHADGAYYALSSAHCFRSQSDVPFVTVGPLKEFAAECVKLDRDADLALIKIVTDKELPFVLFAEKAPERGDEVWHQGFGVNKPGNVERGKITDPGAPGRYQSHTVRLSSGDSGSGLLSGSILVGVNHSADSRLSYASSWYEVRDFLRVVDVA